MHFDMYITSTSKEFGLVRRWTFDSHSMTLWILFHLGIFVFVAGFLRDLTLRGLGLGNGIFGSGDMLDIAIGSLLTLLDLLIWLT
jgi:hypothetical protein